jgi:hypothetical protein
LALQRTTAWASVDIEIQQILQVAFVDGSRLVAALRNRVAGRIAALKRIEEHLRLLLYCFADQFIIFSVASKF